MIEIENVRKSFGPLEVLKGIGVDVHAGEVVCLLGPSGSGKTTCLMMLAGFEDVTSGEILINGRNVTIDEVGNAGAFLCSDLASGISGEILYVDGGFNTTAMGQIEE